MTTNYAPAAYNVLRTPPDEFSICKVTTDLSWSCPTASSAIFDSSIELSPIKSTVIAPAASIEVEIVPESAVVINVPVISGIVIVLSCVGSTTVTVVSKPLSVAPSNKTSPLKVGTASKVNALPVADEVNLGILELSSILNKPFPVSYSLALNVSKQVSKFVSVYLIVLPTTWKVPNVLVVPKAVKLFGIVTSFGKENVIVSWGLTTDCIWLAVPKTVKVSPPPIICVVEVWSEIVHPAVDVAIEIVSFIASTKVVALIAPDKFAISPKSSAHISLNVLLNVSSVSVLFINFTAILLNYSN